MPVVRRDVSRRLRGVGVTPNRRQSYPASRSAWAFLTGETDPSRLPRWATRDEALGIPTFGAGVELLAQAVAGVDMVAQRWDATAGVWARLPEQPNVLTDPDPDATAWHWRYACTKDLIEAGNHVALLGGPDWRTGRPGWLVPLPVADVGLITDPSFPGDWKYAVGGMMLDRSDVLHISAGNRSFEVLGQGIIAQYSEALGQHLTAEEWSARYLAGGGLPPAIIQAAGVPTQAQMDEFKLRWNALTTTGEAIIIPSSATVTPLQSDAQSQQLVEARQWNATQMAQILHIPPHMLGLEGPAMTYQNVETADIAWIKDSVSRWAGPIEARVSKDLMPTGTRARFDWASRMRTDQKTQADVLSVLVSSGVWSTDEARQTIGYRPWGQADQLGSTPAGTPELGAKEAT